LAQGGGGGGRGVAEGGGARPPPRHVRVRSPRGAMGPSRGPLDFADVSFFELDHLFGQSARALRRKLRRKKRKERKEGAEGGSASRSRTPPRRVARARKVTAFGGFTGSVEKVEKTIVVTGVPSSADEKAIFRHFSRCGIVFDVQILRNRQDVATGTCVVEFQEDDGVTRACALAPPHNELNGVAMQAKRADAQLLSKGGGGVAPKRMMTRSQFTQQVLSGLKTGLPALAAGVDAAGPHMRKLHIKNLRPVVTEEDMRGIFKPFGEFEDFSMGTQECWITFQSHNDAQDAMGSMQGFQLVGQELQISMQAVEKPVPPPALPAPPTQEKIDVNNDSDFGATGGAGNPLHNRIELMKKLMTAHQQNGVPTVVGGVTLPTGPAMPPSLAPSLAAVAASVPPTPKPGTPASRTLLLQGMFNPTNVNLQKEPRFYEEIREDTHDECTKFGKVLHVTVDPRGSTGLIYVLYETPRERQAAEMALNGRWFEGKKIAAAGIDDSIWQALAAQAQVAQAAPQQQPPPPPPPPQ